MRNAFAKEITELAGLYPELVLLSGDIGNRLFDEFKLKFPTRFYNCGVAEANMTSVAAGLALSGLRPITYSINPFVTERCYEQIKVDLCFHNLPVIICGIGSGLAYAELGVTHHSCEDIAILRTLPNMTIICPADPVETKLALRTVLERQLGPVFIRLGKKGEPIIHQQTPEFIIGEGIVIEPGNNLCILSTGTILPIALDIARQLKNKNISIQVISQHTIKPINPTYLLNIFTKFRLVVSMEEHNLAGGLGSTLAEWLSDQINPVAKLLRIGIDDKFFLVAGNQNYARQYFGLTVENLYQKIWQRYSLL